MKRMLKIAARIAGGLAILVFAVILFISLSWNREIDRPAPAMTAPHDSTAIARGEYLFKYSWQCWGCHSPSSTSPASPPSGGQVFDLRSTGPGFGIYYSRNLTPDSATGLGRWTDGEIVQAIREGVTKDRHLLFPLMPVDWLSGMSDDDALAIVAYLRSIAPVRNHVADREPSFVAKALITFHVLKPQPPITAPVIAPPAGPTVAYGRYFAMNLAGCADCHTPRNLQNGRFYLDSLFSGSTFAFGNDQHASLSAYARNIRPHDASGIGRWTEAQFIAAVTSGLRADSTTLLPYMPYPNYKFLSADDIRAVYAFLKSLAPIDRPTLPVIISDDFKKAQGASRGGLLFHVRCEPCHGINGGGAQPTNVRLVEVASSIENTDLRDFIAAGQPDLKMPPFGRTLSAEEINDVVAFVRSWPKP